MNQRDDYISGPHNYWVHFVCGFIFGALVGAWFGRWLFGGLLASIIGAVLSGFCFGISCGNWGDRAWKAIFESPWWRS
jgi:uncharacterized membrane protein